MKQHRLKVAIVGQYPKENQVETEVYTGIMRVVHGIAEELRLCPNVKVEIPAKGLKRPDSFIRYLRNAFSFLGKLLRCKAEIFHIHGVGAPMFLSLIIAKLKRKKTIYTAHGLILRETRLGYHYSPISRFFEFSLVKCVDQITTPSQRMRKMITKDYGVDHGKISVIENGVDSSFFDEDISIREKPSQLQKVKSKLVILFVGGTRKVKGLPFLLKSIEVLRKMRKDIVLLIVGEKGDQHEALMSEYSHLLQEGCVRVLGKISEHDLNLMYEIAEMIIVPSLYEPFGLVVLEAMAKGKVVIVSDRVGASSIITNMKDGVIVPYGDVTQLVCEINTLLSDKRKKDKIGINAKETARKYAWKQIAPKYVRCYTQILSANVPSTKDRSTKNKNLSAHAFTRAELKLYYEKEAEYYDDHQKELYSNVNPYRRYPHERRKTLVDCFLKNATNLLDVGCAEGIYFKGRNIPCVGVDIAKKYVLKAKKRYSNAHFVAADVCDLPFRDHAFEHLLSSEVLEHVLDWKRGLGELVRVAENVIVTVPLLTIWMRLNILRKGRKKSTFDKPGRGHINSFTYREFVKQLRANGLIIKKTKGVSWFPTWDMAKFGFPYFLLKFIKFLDKMLDEFGLFTFMATTIIVVAESRCACASKTQQNIANFPLSITNMDE